MSVSVTYAGPQDERYLPDLGVTVARGATFEVSDAFAGTEPSGDAPGTGLLAQVDVFKRATAPVKAAPPAALKEG